MRKTVRFSPAGPGFIIPLLWSGWEGRRLYSWQQTQKNENFLLQIQAQNQRCDCTTFVNDLELLIII